jgi:hypothetical protein
MQMKDTNETLCKHVLKEIVAMQGDPPTSQGFTSTGKLIKQVKAVPADKF